MTVHINELLSHLEDMVIDYNLQFSYCAPESGILFFFPPPQTVSSGSIFAGSVTDWHHLTEKQLIHEECTYLICCEERSIHTLPACRQQVNLLLLNVPALVALQRITAILSCNDFPQFSDTQLYLDFWKDIMSSAITTQKQAESRIKLFPYPMKPHIACIVVHYAKSSGTLPFSEIQQALKAFFPQTNLFFSKKEWIILYSQEKDTSDTLNISYEKFSSLLTRYQLDAGISYVCQLPEMLRTMYITAKMSIQLGKNLDLAPVIARIYTYHQYNPYYVIHLACKSFIQLHKTENLIYLTHPDIIRIYYYDQAKNNNLLDVLFVYLSTGQNINKAAFQLHMHRNTVMNKLNKLEEVLQHKLDFDADLFLLLLSCMIMKYQHKYTHRNIEEYFLSHDSTETNL